MPSEFSTAPCRSFAIHSPMVHVKMRGFADTGGTLFC
jgi:hypothetical protein